jgi:transposase InsO family protein
MPSRLSRAVRTKTAPNEKAGAWDNGCCESVNGKISCTLKDAEMLVETWRRHCNAVRPHSSLGYRLPAPEAVIAAVTPAIWTGASTAAISTALADRRWS